jgi:phospholipase/carboxylesterase
MTEPDFQGIELLPLTPIKQLFILLHGLGAQPADLLPLAETLGAAFPEAALLIPQGTHPFDGPVSGRQWFSVQGMTEENGARRVTEALPALHALVRQAQDRLGILQSDTALVGFSQGAIMALAFSDAYDGGVGRVLAFAGRYAALPDKAPELTTLHLFHGADDPIIPVQHARAAYERLSALGGDATLDVASSVGHTIPDELATRAVYRLQTCIPLRTWKLALNNA